MKGKIMELLITYFMSALPVFISFVAIWWFLSIYVLVSPYRSASRIDRIGAHRTAPKRPEADAPQPELRKVA